MYSHDEQVQDGDRDEDDDEILRCEDPHVTLLLCIGTRRAILCKNNWDWLLKRVFLTGRANHWEDGSHEGEGDGKGWGRGCWLFWG